MLIHSFQDFAVPALGLGCMRLPCDAAGNVRRAEVAQMVDYAMAHGVNYFDTGYDYHGGMSEVVLGEVLHKFARDSYLLADKFPGYAPAYWKRVVEIFETQLARCGVDYFDFYMLHNVSEASIDAYLNPRYHILDYLRAQREAGRIRHLGFSAHGSIATIERLLRESDMPFSFAMIQLNYIDYAFQHAREKMELLQAHGLPVFVMEPLRGGKLANLPVPFAAEVAARFPEQSAAEAAFRFVQSFPVGVTLSGVSNFAQLQENIAIFDRMQPLSAEERAVLVEIAAKMTAVGTVPCTACGYCKPYCKMGLDIPNLLAFANEHAFSGGGFIAPSAIASMKRTARPSACVGCRACEEVCPQNIEISRHLSEFSQKLNLK